MRIVPRSKHPARLLDGAAQGAYRLPPAIAEAAAMADRAAAVNLKPRPPAADTVWRATVDEAVAAFLDGTPAPDPSKAVEANRAAHLKWERSETLRVEVANELERRMQAMVEELADDIIVKSLQPALAEVVTTITDAAAVLPDDSALTGTVALLQASDQIRHAWLAADAASTRYRRITMAVELLSARPEHDVDGEFAWISNMDDVWPRPVHRNLPPANKPPWPDEDPQRLLWLIRHGAKLIAPTTVQRDQMWLAKYRERVAQQRMAQQNAAAYGAILAR